MIFKGENMANTATTMYPHNATKSKAAEITEQRRQATQERKQFLSKFNNGFVGKEAIDAFFKKTPLLGC